MNDIAAYSKTESFHPRRELLLASWLARKLPPRDYLLADVLCTTSRWLIFGDTGIGKTLLALSMAGTMASAGSFLGWEGKRRARVMYLDGEMPAETFKERMQLVADECGENISLFGYNREVLKPDEMPPFNLPEGEAWLWREIDAVRPDAIFFDSIMCLLMGSMSEEESWAPVKLLMRKISARRIAQVWLHHTGHDASKGFGTKTREWELDTVAALTTTEDSQGVLLDFRKARLRTPKTAEAFKSRVIIRDERGWAVTGDVVKKANGSGKSDVQLLKLEMIKAYNRLADGLPTSPGLDGAPVYKLPVEKLRDELKSRGFLEAKKTGGLTPNSRTRFHRAKTEVISANRFVELDGLIWKVGAPPLHVHPL